MRKALVLTLLCTALSCTGNPSAPKPAGPLADGNWSGGGACLAVADTCNMIAGCGHGVFPRPTIRDDGTFDVDGTYRIEVGPVSIDPAPPAHFSGSISGSTLTLTVVPSGSIAKGTYTMQAAAAANCGIRCV